MLPAVLSVLALAWQRGAPLGRSLMGTRAASAPSGTRTASARLALDTDVLDSTCASCIGTVPQASLQQPYDLVVVGGGPAGVAGALKGAYLGKRVLIVDKPKAAPPEGGLDPFFGGPTGLFSKALRDAAKTFEVNGLAGMGLNRDVIFHQVRTSCLGLATNNAITSLKLLERFKVDYLQGEATLGSIFNGPSSEHKLTVRLHASPTESVQVRADRVLLCTGSYPRRPPSIPFDDYQIFDPDSINAGISFLPKSVVIAGSGIIAIEYAQIFRKLGAEVTMVVRGAADNALARIGLDDTMAERLIGGLVKDGVTILEDTEIKAFKYLEPNGAGDKYESNSKIRTLSMTLSSGDTLESELYMACVGRVPRGRGTSLGLEAAGLHITERGHIKVDQNFQTSQPGIYAAGDCTEGPALASTGVDQAQRATEKMWGCHSDTMCCYDTKPYPIGMWTTPECAYYGLTQKQAIEKGYDAEVGMATYDACLRGRVFSPDGTLKLVFDRDTTKILGVHIIGTDACELVHYGMDLVSQEVTIFEVINTLFTAVTYHELFKEAALNGNGKLDFGIEWQELLAELGASMSTLDGAFNEAELRARFDEIDESGDGALDGDELLQVFEREGAKIEPSIIPNLIRLADDDGNGTIEWDEFLKIFKVLHKMRENTSGSTAGVVQPAAPPKEQSSWPEALAVKAVKAMDATEASAKASRPGVYRSQSPRWGVSRPFEARGDVDGRQVSLGHFGTEAEAAMAYARHAGKLAKAATTVEKTAVVEAETATKASDNTETGYAGVHRNPSSRWGGAKPFEARGDVEGRLVSLGHYGTAAEAAMTYARHTGTTAKATTVENKAAAVPVPTTKAAGAAETGSTGVYRNPSSRWGGAKPYEARADVDGRQVSLGHYSTIAQAAMAWARHIGTTTKASMGESEAVVETETATKASDNAETGYAGVYRNLSSRWGGAKPFEARGDVDGRQVSLGHFGTEAEAAMAYTRHITPSLQGVVKKTVYPSRPAAAAGSAAEGIASTGFTGVYEHQSTRWAGFKPYEAKVSLGHFGTKAEAAAAYAHFVKKIAEKRAA